MSADPSSFATNPSIFLRLNAAEARPRELAWDEFRQRYGPIIAGFARKVGARPQDVDDVIQDVLLGFFAKSPTFVYDPSKGRFRGYLKVCTYRALRKRVGQNAKFNGVPLENVESESAEVEQAWNDIWEKDLVRRAMEALRTEMKSNRSFQAFEQHVIFDRPAKEVADQLGLHVNSVYRAREQLSQKLRERLASLRKSCGN